MVNFNMKSTAGCSVWLLRRSALRLAHSPHTYIVGDMPNSAKKLPTVRPGLPYVQYTLALSAKELGVYNYTYAVVQGKA